MEINPIPGLTLWLKQHSKEIEFVLSALPTIIGLFSSKTSGNGGLAKLCKIYQNLIESLGKASTLFNCYLETQYVPIGNFLILQKHQLMKHEFIRQENAKLVERILQSAIDEG